MNENKKRSVSGLAGFAYRLAVLPVVAVLFFGRPVPGFAQYARPVRDIGPHERRAVISNTTDVNGVAFFTAFSLFTGAELWKSDGAGAVLVKEILPVFNVRKVKNPPFLAAAFFPFQQREMREILATHYMFDPEESPFTPAGVLRHELGHALGFRHEHIRPGVATCACAETFDSTWRALTEYDPYSVMNQPWCGGTPIGDWELSDLDRRGAAMVYP